MKKNRREKLNKYTQNIEDTLDLHGFYEKEAIVAVLNFIKDSQTKSMKHVRIIVGKGTHSIGQESILGNAVRECLHERSLSYRDAKLDGGGSGAIDVSL